MISAASKFKLFHRGFKRTIALIPGWATDYRIFNTLELNYNYLLPIEYYPFDFAKELRELLNRESIDKISLFGWSMGGFLASDFASKSPERVEELVLLSIQKKFDQVRLKDIELKLEQNRKAYLYRFYLDCFSGDDRETFRWFKKNLLKNYINEISIETLFCGLDYLSETQINPESLAGIKRIRIFHGQDDKIVPLDEAQQLKSELSKAQFICLPGTGHIPFLNCRFKESFFMA